MLTSFLIWTCCTLCFTFNGVTALRTTNDINFWNPLIKEVQDAGGYIHPNVHLSYNNIGGLSVISDEDIPTDTIIMSVPQTLTLKNEDILREFPSWKNLPILSDESEVAPASLYISYHSLSKGNPNPTPLFVKYAPDNCNNGYFFESDVVRMLDDRAQGYFLSSQEHLVKEWEEIQNALKNGTIENDEILSSITFSTYKWATCITYTRRYRRESGPGSILIPLGDMFNHDTIYNTYWYYMRENSSWIWKTSGVVKGAPITINYGWMKENLELLFVYGFSVVDNRNEVGHLSSPVDSPVKELVIDLFKNHSKDFVEYNQTGITDKELIISRITNLPKHQLTSYHISKLISGDILWPLERDLWDSLYRKCFTQMTDDIPGGSAEKDQILLEETIKEMLTKKSKGAQRYWETKVAALQYRIYRRTFVRRVCGWIYLQLKRVGGGYD